MKITKKRKKMLQVNSSTKTLETWRLLPKEVQTLIVASFFVAVGFGVIVPSMPIYSRSFGVSAAAVGLVISSFAVMRFVSGLFSGKLVNKFGERHVFAFGVFMVAITTFLTGIAANYWQLLTFRTAGGLGSSMFSVAASSVIFKSIGPELRGRAQSLYNGTFLVGAVAGPAVGGLLMSISLRAPFFGYSIMLIISGTIAYRYLKASHLEPSINRTDDEMSIRDAISLPAFRVAIITSFLFSLAIMGPRFSIIPIFVVEDLNGSNSFVGYVYTATALIQGAFLMRAGQLSDVRGRRLMLKMGSTITFTGMSMFLFAGHKSIFVLAMMIIGFGTAFISTTPSAIVADVITGKSGKVIGFFQMAGDAGMIVGPVLIGLLADLYSFQTAFAATLAIYSLTVLLAWRMPETLVAAKD